MLLLWLAFVVCGPWYCAMAPAWEGYDEPFHFAYLQHVAAGLGPPARTTPVSLEAAPLRWMAGEPLLTQLFTLRMLNVLLASAAVPLAYVLARQVFGPARALATTALLVLLPELMINVARASNECLTMICYTAVLIAAVKAVAEPLRWRWWLLLGAALGCGLLTKAYFLTAMPALMVLAIYCLLKQEAVPDRPRLAVAARIGAAFALVLTTAGVLYLRVHALTGSWSEYGDDAALRGMSLGQKLMAVPHVNWKSVASRFCSVTSGLAV